MASSGARFPFPVHGTPMPSEDARTAPRQQTMFAVGRIVLLGRECVCLVRNMSATGAGVEHDGALPIEVAGTIETRSMLPTRAVVRWSTATAAGLEFLERPRILGGTVTAGCRPECLPRSPRFAVDREATLIVGDVRLATRLRDIALGGVRLTGVDAVPISGPARLAIRDTAWVLPGRIRWTIAGDAGFQFVTPLTSHELAALLGTPRGATP